MFIYRSCFWAPGCFVIDCEQHLFSAHSKMFADAVGRALLHRQEAHR
jgi:hypothetical protein